MSFKENNAEALLINDVDNERTYLVANANKIAKLEICHHSGMYIAFGLNLNLKFKSILICALNGETLKTACCK
jgi:hypothetical protein